MTNMNTKDIIDPTEAMKFVSELAHNDNTVDVVRTVDGVYRISWIKNKKYTSFDGKEFTDEVWTKEDGTMIACQDLDPEHAKNIIRMYLRQTRETQKYFQGLDELISGLDDKNTNDELPATEDTRILH
jgi:hypothetical protein